VDYGHTYHFRCRAEDTLGNIEDYPADADAEITVARAIYGTVRGNRGAPMLGATVTITPPGYTTGFSYHDGSYEAFVSSTGSYTSEVKASKAGSGALPPMHDVQVPADDSVGDVDFVLPPSDDIVTNGSFESGSTGWTTTGSTSGSEPTFPSDNGHTGTGYALLATAMGGTSTLIQGSLDIDSSIISPTLSFMYWYDKDTSCSFKIYVNDILEKELTTDTGPGNWTHYFVDLKDYSGYTVPIKFEIGCGGSAVASGALDEVSLGSAAGEPVAMYLPVVEKRYYGD
jgi:hypothetical protein